MVNTTIESGALLATVVDTIVNEDSTFNGIYMNVTSAPPPANRTEAAPFLAILGLPILFCIIGFSGIVGNFLVIWVIVTDRKMRSSVTNLFILNLAAADLLIMLFGVPEIAQFMINKGWLMGPAMCKLERYVLVFSLYVSIMSLVSVCVERYIAIVHPIRAHILCSRTKIVVAIAIIWPTSLLLGLPTALFNQVRKPRPDFPVKLCMLTFPTGYEPYQLGYKLIELSIFFIGPVFIQTILYAIICKQLFVGTQELHRRTAVSKGDGTIRREKESDAIKARKGVVKMLIASVVVYFLSYAPAQVPLLYNVIFNDTFNRNWSFLVLIMILAYVNSAANPILYCIFSQNFRRRFGRALCACARRYNGVNYSRKCAATVDTSMGTRGVVRCSSLLTNTATTALMSEA